MFGRKETARLPLLRQRIPNAFETGAPCPSAHRGAAVRVHVVSTLVQPEGDFDSTRAQKARLSRQPVLRRLVRVRHRMDARSLGRSFRLFSFLGAFPFHQRTKRIQKLALTVQYVTDDE